MFRRTRVTVGVMTRRSCCRRSNRSCATSATRFRGGESVAPGTPRYELGLQQREDALHRLIDVWATGEASASLGFAAARLFDELDPLEQRKTAIFAGDGIAGGGAELQAVKRLVKDAVDYLRESVKPDGMRNDERYQALAGDDLVRFVVTDAVANVLCPATKLWNTGYGATMMREAVSLMGGYGITEDCPGFLGQKWMDAQLEATYEGPEAVQRRQLSVTMTDEVFLAQFEIWISRDAAHRGAAAGHGRVRAGERHGAVALDAAAPAARDRRERRTGCTRAVAAGRDVPAGRRAVLAAGVALPDPRCDGARGRGPGRAPDLADGLAGLVAFLSDLCHVQAARAAGEVGRVCGGTGVRLQPPPGVGRRRVRRLLRRGGPGGARADHARHREHRRRVRRRHRVDGSHRAKAGPCVRFRVSTTSCGSAAGWTAAWPAPAWPRTARPKR